MKKLIMTTLLLACFALTSYSQDKQENAKQKPKATYSVGAAKVTVWMDTISYPGASKQIIKPNDLMVETPNTHVVKHFKVEKVYKKDGEWKSSSSFNEKELLELKAAIDKAIAEERVKVETTK